MKITNILSLILLLSIQPITALTNTSELVEQSSSSYILESEECETTQKTNDKKNWHPAWKYVGATLAIGITIIPVFIDIKQFFLGDNHQNYYQVLGIKTFESNSKEIHNAWERIQAQHVGINPTDTNAPCLLKDAHKAHEILSNSRSRRAYEFMFAAYIEDECKGNVPNYKPSKNN